MTEEQISVKLGVNASQVNHGLEQAKHSVEEFGHHVKESFNDITKELMAPLAGAGLIAGVERVFGKVEEIERVSEAVGVTAEQYQRLAYALKLSGVEGPQVEKTLEKLSGLIGEANNGIAMSAKKFDDWHIALKDSNGTALTTMQVFDEITDRVASMSSASDKAGIAMDLLSKSGAKFVSSMSEGSAALHKRGDGAAIFNDADIRNIKEAHESIEAVGNTLLVATGKAISFTASVGAGLGKMFSQGFTGDWLDAYGKSGNDQRDVDTTRQIAEMKKVVKERMATEKAAKDQAVIEDQVRKTNADQADASTEEAKASKLESEIQKLSEKNKTNQQQYNDALKERNILQEAYQISAVEFGNRSVATLMIQLQLQQKLNQLKELRDKPDVTPDEPLPASHPNSPHYQPDPSYKPFHFQSAKPWKPLPNKPWRPLPKHVPWRVPGMPGADDPSSQDYDHNDQQFGGYDNAPSSTGIDYYGLFSSAPGFGIHPGKAYGELNAGPSEWNAGSEELKVQFTEFKNWIISGGVVNVSPDMK